LILVYEPLFLYNLYLKMEIKKFKVFSKVIVPLCLLAVLCEASYPLKRNLKLDHLSIPNYDKS
jgi:hypothetical protein